MCKRTFRGPNNAQVCSFRHSDTCHLLPISLIIRTKSYAECQNASKVQVAAVMADCWGNQFLFGFGITNWTPECQVMQSITCSPLSSWPSPLPSCALGTY